MLPMAQQIEKLADTYKPEQLQQKYKMTQELMYLLALQQVQSETKRAQAALMASQQAQPGTVKEQLEKQAVDEKVKQIGGVLNTAEQARQQRMMQRAQGGIVGYQGGGQMGRTQMPTQPYQPTEEEIEDYIESVGTRLGRRGSRSISRDVAIRAIQAQKQEEQRQQGLGSVIGGRSGAAVPPNVPMVEVQTAQATAPTTPTTPAAPSTGGTSGPQIPVLPPGGGVMQLDPSGKPQGLDPSLPLNKLQAQAGTGTGTGTGGGGIASLTQFEKPKDVKESLPEGYYDAVTGRAMLDDTGIAAISKKAEERADRISGRAEKARKFERIRQEKDALSKELLDPDKLNRQTRRNLFAAFGRGGNSFGQLMANGLNAISNTEAGQDQLKRVLLNDKHGVDTLSMEVDLKAADQTNRSVDVAINAAKADRRQAENTIQSLTKEKLQAQREYARNVFDFQSRNVQTTLEKAKLLSRQLDRQATRDVANLNSLTTQINQLRTARKDAIAEILSTSTRYLELSAKLERGDIDEKEAEELNGLKKAAEAEIYARLGETDEVLQRLEKEATDLRAKQEYSSDDILKAASS